MRDSTLFFSCALLAAAGALTLFLSISQPDPAKAGTAWLGGGSASVEISGEIKSAYARNGNLFLQVCAGECTRAVIFHETAEKLAASDPRALLLKKGAHVRLFGKSSEYNGAKSVVVERLEVLD